VVPTGEPKKMILLDKQTLKLLKPQLMKLRSQPKPKPNKTISLKRTVNLKILEFFLTIT